MDSPVPVLTVFVLYLVMVKQGPKMMEQRKPFQVQGPMVLYNLAVMVLSIYITFEVTHLSSKFTMSKMHLIACLRIRILVNLGEKSVLDFAVISLKRSLDLDLAIFIHFFIISICVFKIVLSEIDLCRAVFIQLKVSTRGLLRRSQSNKGM